MDKINEIAEYYGLENRLRQLTEECCELIEACEEAIRLADAGSHLYEEVADVGICVDQVIHLMDCEEAVEKTKNEIYVPPRMTDFLPFTKQACARCGKACMKMLRDDVDKEKAIAGMIEALADVRIAIDGVTQKQSRYENVLVWWDYKILREHTKMCVKKAKEKVLG